MVGGAVATAISGTIGVSELRTGTFDASSERLFVFSQSLFRLLLFITLIQIHLNITRSHQIHLFNGQIQKVLLQHIRQESLLLLLIGEIYLRRAVLVFVNDFIKA